METIKQLLSAISTWMCHIRKMWQLWVRRHAWMARIVLRITDILSLLGAIGCIVSLVALVGYDRDEYDVRRLLGSFRLVQWIFIANILLSITLNFRDKIANTKVIRWIVEVPVLLTLIPLLWPRPEHPWIPTLAAVLYSKSFLLTVLMAYSLVEICAWLMQIFNRRTNPSLILAFSFVALIGIGSFLLMMPRSLLHPISYVDSLMVATSAVCITGLTPIDIPTTFTPFGQAILAFMIQTGGLGVLTFTSLFALFFSGNTSVYSQLMVKDIIYTKSINSLLSTLLYIMTFTIVVELIGAVAVWWTLRDVLPVGLEEQFWIAGFHSISAFCNAGFSNLPGGMANAALMNSNQLIYLVVSTIVIAGSIGFPLLVNVRDACKEYLRRLLAKVRGQKFYGRQMRLYNVNSRLSLYTTLVLFIVSAIVFWLFERHNTLEGMSLYDQICQSIFNSTTPRSSGFMTVDPASFLNPTLIMVMFLMWVGGATQSTAGGVKVNTLAALLLNVRASVMGRNSVTAFNRTIAPASIARAGSVVILSIVAYVIYSMVVLTIEPELSVKAVLFEVSSALFTVGSSLGITSELCDTAKIVLCTAMFLGRVGIISLLIGVTGHRHTNMAKFPTDNIIIN